MRASGHRFEIDILPGHSLCLHDTGGVTFQEVLAGGPLACKPLRPFNVAFLLQRGNTGHEIFNLSQRPCYHDAAGSRRFVVAGSRAGQFLERADYCIINVGSDAHSRGAQIGKWPPGQIRPANACKSARARFYERHGSRFQRHYRVGRDGAHRSGGGPCGERGSSSTGRQFSRKPYRYQSSTLLVPCKASVAGHPALGIRRGRLVINMSSFSSECMTFPDAIGSDSRLRNVIPTSSSPLDFYSWQRGAVAKLFHFT